MFEFHSESTWEPGKDFQLGSGVIRFAFYSAVWGMDWRRSSMELWRLVRLLMIMILWKEMIPSPEAEEVEMKGKE